MADPFQPKFVDLVCNYTASTGTGNFTLGPTVNGFSSFASALQPGDNFYYSALGLDKPAEREVGRGTLQANGSIARDPISGAKTNFTTGTKIVALIAAAEWYNAVQARGSGVADGNKGDITVSNNGAAWALSPAGLAKIFITPQQYGAKGDGTTDDSAAFVAAIAYLKSIGVNNDANIYKGSRKLFVPAGLYNLGTTTLDISHTLIIEGESSVNGCGSRLMWTGNCDGIRVQATNTSGTSTVDGPHFGGTYTIIRNLGLAGPYANNPDFTGKAEGEFHAINVRSNVIVEDVLIDGFAGDGVHANTTAGGGGVNEGNSNCSFINRLKVTNVRNGVFLDGADANAWTIIGVIGTYCRRWTVWDSSFLGNTHIGHHSANAGLIKGVPATIVSYSGNRYTVAAGQAANAATNAPSGTTADNAYWLYLSAGAVDATLNVPAWTSGVSVREGGCFYHDNPNAYATFIGMYSEGGQGPMQFIRPAQVIGGTWGGRAPVSVDGNVFNGAGYVLKTGGSLGQSRVQSTSTSRTLGVHNSQALASSIPASLTFEQGYESDGVTPANLARIYAQGSSANPATTEAMMVFQTRMYANPGVFADRFMLDGINLNVRPSTDNNLDLGTASFRWKSGYFYAVNAATSVTSAGVITSSGGGVGYATGAGGAVTQATSKSTGVTLNKLSGQITTNAAALASAGVAEFTVTNSQVAATDIINVNLASGAATSSAYRYWISAVAAGSFKVAIENRSGGSLSEALILNFAVGKAVSA